MPACPERIHGWDAACSSCSHTHKKQTRTRQWRKRKRRDQTGDKAWTRWRRKGPRQRTRPGQGGAAKHGHNRPGQGLKQNTQTFTKPRQRPSRTKAWTGSQAAHTSAHIHRGQRLDGVEKKEPTARTSKTHGHEVVVAHPVFFLRPQERTPTVNCLGGNGKSQFMVFIDHSGWVAPVESYPCACGILRNKNKADSIVNPANICLMHDGSTV